MNKVPFVFFLLAVSLSWVKAQSDSLQNSASPINNLVLPADYKCSVPGALPPYSKTGKGSHTLILIPGMGFDKSIFDDFTKANKGHYTIYRITVPGYGDSQAPPLPPDKTSFGEQTWNKSILAGIQKLMAHEHIRKAVLVGHFVQGTQLALRMAIDFPELVEGVIILGGPAKFILINKGKPIEYPLASTIKYIDQVTAPTWFKSISKADFDNGNYLPEVYSLDAFVGLALWKQSAAAPISVYVHYLCEFFASDVTLEISKIKCPVLILRPTFNDKVLENPTNNYLIPQFIETWDKVRNINPMFSIVDIPNAATFVWKDNFKAVNDAIGSFLNGIFEASR